MNFTAKKVPYQQTGYFSKIILDYLSGKDILKTFYEHPVSFEGLEAAIRNREQFPTDRELLNRVLTEQYAGLAKQTAVNKNLEKLLQKNTFTVTTAHQPAIFTGNLYFIYKILHVIKLAEALQSRFPKFNFVPVFFMGSEDADLDELGHIYLDNEKISWDTLQTGSVGRMKTTGLEKIIDRIEGEFAGHEYGSELVRLLRSCYLGAGNIQEATLNLLHQLFGKYGLVVLIPDHRGFKTVMRGIFKDDLTRHTPFEITQANLQNLSRHYPVQANPREINLFYLKDDLRERLELKEDRYAVHQSPIYFSREEMNKELEEFPERFSPNVILRGIFQETILPNIAFVGGGGETAYWLELKPLFRSYGVPYPVLILRNSFLLIRKNWKAKMEKSGLSAYDMFKPEEKLMEEYIRQHSTQQLTLDKQIVDLRGIYSSISSISASVDKTLEQHVEKLETQTLSKLEELEKKIFRAEKKNHEEIRRKIHELREALFPLENLQERIENFIPWYAQFGKEFISTLLKYSLTIEQEFVVLEEE